MNLLFMKEFGLEAGYISDNFYSAEAIMKDVQSFLFNKHFGESVDTFTFVFRVAMDIPELMRYSPSKKSVLVTTEIDVEHYRRASVEYLRIQILTQFLNAILKVSEMRRKPKHFDYKEMHNQMRSYIVEDLGIKLE